MEWKVVIRSYDFSDNFEFENLREAMNFYDEMRVYYNTEEIELVKNK